jgi:hypothetical protein
MHYKDVIYGDKNQFILSKFIVGHNPNSPDYIGVVPKRHVDLTI